MIRKTAALAAAWLACSTAYAVDGVGLEIGRGNDRTSLIRIAARERWRKNVFWELSAGAWDNHEESTADVGLTPVFRLEGETLYLEAAIGLHLVQRRISAHRLFSTALQFGDHVGVGIRSGRYELGIALQHLSNGGLRHPNPGINFVLLRLNYGLE